MKKLFTSLFLLMVGVIMLQAQTLSVAGKSIDLSSNGTYSGGNITSGTVTYTASSNTLTLKDVVISGNSSGILGMNLPSLTIELTGNVNITISGMSHGMRFQNCYVTLKGDHHSLNITGSSVADDFAGINLIAGSTLRVWNTHLKITNVPTAIYGNNTDDLQFIRVDGNIQGTKEAIRGFRNFVVSDDNFIFTEGATFQSGTGVVGSSGSLLKNVQIRPFLTVGTIIVRTANDTYSEGKASWDKSTKTLTLSEGFSATSGYPVVCNYKVDGLKIKTAAAGTFQSTNSNAFELYKATTFASSYMMTVKANGNYTAIYPMKAEANLTFDNCSMDVSGAYGIDGSGTESDQATLTFKNANVKASGTSCVMGRIVGATLTGCGVYTPSGVYYDSSQHGFVNSTGALATGVIVIKKATTNYNVSILKTELNDITVDNLYLEGLTSGTITYDKDNKVLTLNGVTLNGPEENEGDTEVYGISGSGLSKIVFSGTNQITNDGTCFYLTSPVTMEGSGKIYATSNKHSGIYNGGGLTINMNSEAKFFGLKNGIYGNSGTLTLKKAGNGSDYYFQGTNVAAIRAGALTLTDMDFWSGSDGTPGCYFDDGYVKQNPGNNVLGEKVVNFYRLNDGDKYGIKVGGVEVTRCNASGIGSKYITAGDGQAVKYISNSKMLMLNGATINTGNDGENCLYINNDVSDPVYINVATDSELRSTGGNYSSLNIWRTTTIYGNGKLSLTGGWGDLYASENAVVTLDDIDMDIVGRLFAGNGEAKLKISLTTEGKRINVNGSVYGWNAISLEDGTKILQPEGASIDGGRVVVGVSTASGIVFGDASATGIEGVTMDPNAEVQGIYDAEGRQLNEMQPGVNIVRMSDGTMRKVVRK